MAEKKSTQSKKTTSENNTEAPVKNTKKIEQHHINYFYITILAAFVGLGLGFVLGNNAATDNHDHSHESSEMKQDDNTMEDDHMHGDDHTHGDEVTNVSAESIPTVEMTVTEDPVKGWNISLKTTNFDFAPEKAGLDHVPGEGHAHLYVDGEKVARLYGNDFHYDGNLDGEHTFEVTLNANDHTELAVDGEVIQDSVLINHSHSNP